MNKINKLVILFLILTLAIRCSSEDDSVLYESKLPKGIKRHWISEYFWANRLEDWQLSNGRIECINAKLPLRTVHLLPYSISTDSGSVHLEVEIGTISDNDSLKITDFAGIMLGAGDANDDFRKRALIHGVHTQSSGIIAAISGNGKILFLDGANHGELLNLAAAEEISVLKYSKEGLFLQIDIKPEGDGYSILLSIIDKKSGSTLSYGKIMGIDRKKIQGNIALVANGGRDINDASFWFQNLTIKGNKLSYKPQETISPIVGTLFTNFDSELNLIAQFMPLARQDSKEVTLEVTQYSKEQWQTLAKAKIDTFSFSAKFKVKLPNPELIYQYRVVYNAKGEDEPKLFYYNGIIPKNVEKQNLVKLALFNNTFFSDKQLTSPNFDFTQNNLLFPNKLLTSDIKKQKPDLCVFFGGQVTEKTFEVASYSSFYELKINYLYKWYLWFWQFGELTAKYPSILLPNNTDYFSSHLETNKKEALSQRLKDKKDAQDFLKLVYTTQCYSNTFASTEDFDLKNTSFKFGNINFAFLANNLVDTAQSQLNPLLVDTLPNPYENFLKYWTADWQHSEIKAILTHFPIVAFDSLNSVAHRIAAQENPLIKLAQQNMASLISPSNNQSNLIKHGIKSFGDASYNYFVPSLTSNGYMNNQNADFYNTQNIKLKFLAIPEATIKNQNKRYLAYGIVKFNKFQSTTDFENRTLEIDLENNVEKFTSWNKTISINNNYVENSAVYLPTIKVKGTTTPPTYYIYDNKTREFIYALKAKDIKFKPKVFYWGTFDVEIYDHVSGKKLLLEKVYSKNASDTTSISVKF